MTLLWNIWICGCQSYTFHLQAETNLLYQTKKWGAERELFHQHPVM